MTPPTRRPYRPSTREDETLLPRLPWMFWATLALVGLAVAQMCWVR